VAQDPGRGRSASSSPDTDPAPPVEIERRFLIRPERLPALPRGDALVQGYLAFAPVIRVRIRRSPGGRLAAFLTIKGRGTRRRAEFEYPIPLAHARAIMKLCGPAVIRKTRHHLGPWELDRYSGLLQGLWLAEVEPRPAWLGREVTGDPRYTNARLARPRRRPAWL
jgi:adenylate cyclase